MNFSYFVSSRMPPSFHDRNICNIAILVCRLIINIAGGRPKINRNKAVEWEEFVNYQKNRCCKTEENRI